MTLGFQLSPLTENKDKRLLTVGTPMADVILATQEAEIRKITLKPALGR
jgi:hypothetical protein